MKILLRNKWFVFFIILILILLLAAAGVFLWQKYKEPDVGYVFSDEFIITESGGEKIIEYKEGGFKMRIPGDWDTHNSNGVKLLFTSPDFQLHPNVGPFGAPLPEKGCSTALSIAKEGTFGTGHIGQLIEACPTIGQDCNEYKIIEINGNRGLKYIYSLEENLIPGQYISIEILKKKRVYIFEAHLFSQDRERCEREFDKILNTVEIRK